MKAAEFMAPLSKFLKQSTLKHLKFSHLSIKYLKKNSSPVLGSISNPNNFFCAF